MLATLHATCWGSLPAIKGTPSFLFLYFRPFACFCSILLNYVCMCVYVFVYLVLKFYLYEFQFFCICYWLVKFSFTFCQKSAAFATSLSLLPSVFLLSFVVVTFFILAFLYNKTDVSRCFSWKVWVAINLTKVFFSSSLPSFVFRFFHSNLYYFHSYPSFILPNTLNCNFSWLTHQFLISFIRLFGSF